MRIFLAALMLATSTGLAVAQTSYPDLRGAAPGIATIPFPFTPLPPGQYEVSVTQLTVPPGARYAVVCAQTATVYFTTDGQTIPTATSGVPLVAGSCIPLYGSQTIKNFMIHPGTGTITAEYWQ